jgi:hypothetical protein
MRGQTMKLQFQVPTLRFCVESPSLVAEKSERLSQGIASQAAEKLTNACTTVERAALQGRVRRLQ